MEYTTLWILAALGAVFIEINTPGLFYFLSFAGGALGSAFLAFLDYNLQTQLYGCLVATAITFILLRRYASQNSRQIPLTNIASLIGKEAIVLEEITPNLHGSIKIYGEIWSATTHGLTPLPVDTRVRIVKIQGTVATVAPIYIEKE